MTIICAFAGVGTLFKLDQILRELTEMSAITKDSRDRTNNKFYKVKSAPALHNYVPSPPPFL